MRVASRWPALWLLAASVCCRRSSAPQSTPSVAAPRPGPADLPGVVDPWLWPRAAGASDHEKAIEDVGPYEPLDRGVPGAPLVNTNAHYWTELVGIAWDRDVDIDFDDEPVDLNGDGVVDARITRHIHAPGGILAHPEVFGLTPTPDDPRGRVGRISASTSSTAPTPTTRSNPSTSKLRPRSAAR